MHLSSYFYVKVRVGRGKALVVITYHVLHGGGQAALGIASHIYRHHKINRLFIIYYIKTPGAFEFLDRLANLLYCTGRRDQGILREFESGGNGSVTTRVLGIDMIIATDRSGHVHFIRLGI